jgi:hypothetical protein
MPQNRNLICCSIFLVAGIILSVLYYSYPVHDFGNYYYGSRFATEGKNISDIYEPYKFNLAVRELPEMQHEKFLLNYAVVPPFTLFFYAPLTALDVHLSKFVFNLISVLVFCFFLFKLLEFLNLKNKWILLLPILVFIPFRNNLLFGQAYLLLTGFIMGGFLAESKNKNLPAAIYYSLAIVLKISPAILLLYLLLRKKFRLLLFTAVISSILFLLPVLITGWNFMLDYLVKSIPRMVQNEINNPFATTYQSITVLLRNLFISDQLLNPDSTFNAPVIFSVLSGIITGILFLLLVIKITKSADDFSAFAITLFGSLVLTSYTSSYSLVLAIPLCLFVLRNDLRKITCLLLIFLIANIPVSAFQSLPLLLRFPRLYLLIGLFLLITYHKEIFVSHFKWFLASIVFFIGVSFMMLKKSDEASTYFLSNEAGLLSYDFQISGNNLLLKTLYEDGSRDREYVLADGVRSINPLSIVNGQVYYNGSITNGSDNKLNPILINNSEVIYLSDKNRGIGFYTLRKLMVKEKRH